MRKLILVVSLATLGFSAVLGNLKAPPSSPAVTTATQSAPLALLANLKD